MESYSMPSLSDYLASKGWDIISPKFYFNEQDNKHIKIDELNKLHYFENNIEMEEIPLIYILHKRINHLDQAQYNKTLRFLDILDRREMTALYHWSHYSFVEFNENNFAFLEFDGIKIITTDGTIECSANTQFTELFSPENGVINAEESNWCFGKSNYEKDEVVRNILIELGLMFNPYFYYDSQNTTFEVTLNDKKEILDYNEKYLGT